MADERRRELGRRSSGDAEAAARHLLERVRAGEISDDRVFVAAWAGDPTSQLVMADNEILKQLIAERSRRRGSVSLPGDIQGANERFNLNLPLNEGDRLLGWRPMLQYAHDCVRHAVVSRIPETWSALLAVYRFVGAWLRNDARLMKEIAQTAEWWTLSADEDAEPFQMLEGLRLQAGEEANHILVEPQDADRDDLFRVRSIMLLGESLLHRLPRGRSQGYKQVDTREITTECLDSLQGNQQAYAAEWEWQRQHFVDLLLKNPKRNADERRRVDRRSAQTFSERLAWIINEDVRYKRMPDLVSLTIMAVLNNEQADATLDWLAGSDWYGVLDKSSSPEASEFRDAFNAAYREGRQPEPYVEPDPFAYLRDRAVATTNPDRAAGSWGAVIDMARLFAPEAVWRECARLWTAEINEILDDTDFPYDYDLMVEARDQARDGDLSDAFIEIWEEGLSTSAMALLRMIAEVWGRAYPDLTDTRSNPKPKRNGPMQNLSTKQLKGMLKKLEAYGITSAEDLLGRCKTAAGRKAIREHLDLTEAQFKPLLELGREYASSGFLAELMKPDVKHKRGAKMPKKKASNPHFAIKAIEKALIQQFSMRALAALVTAYDEEEREPPLWVQVAAVLGTDEPDGRGVRSVAEAKRIASYMQGDGWDGVDGVIPGESFDTNVKPVMREIAKVARARGVRGANDANNQLAAVWIDMGRALDKMAIVYNPATGDMLVTEPSELIPADGTITDYMLTPRPQRGPRGRIPPSLYESQGPADPHGRIRRIIREERDAGY